MQNRPEKKSESCPASAAPLQIRRTAVCGMGALGLLFGGRIQENLGENSVTFLMDQERVNRHSRDTYTINGKTRSFPIREYSEGGPYDLVMLAVKYGAMREAARAIAPAVGPDTVLISVMNGIESEECLAGYYDRAHIIDSVALGMDAMRTGTALVYTKFGHLEIGAADSSQEESLARLTDFFDRAGIPYVASGDVRHTMWRKFMLNVGINQACTAYETGYGGVLSPGPIHDEMVDAMREVSKIAAKKGILLTEEDIQSCFTIAATLDPEAYPSMRQDAVAHRKTEVDMFAGRVIALGKEVGVPTPVNESYYRKIKAIEAAF